MSIRSLIQPAAGMALALLLVTACGDVNAGNVDVELVNGSVDGTVTLPAHGEIRFASGNGDLDLRIPASTSATFAAFVNNSGSISRENLDLTDVVQTNRSLTGILGDGAGAIELETTNGHVHVAGFDG
jgi:hypothetical protein